MYVAYGTAGAEAGLALASSGQLRRGCVWWRHWQRPELPLLTPVRLAGCEVLTGPAFLTNMQWILMLLEVCMPAVGQWVKG